MRVDAKMQNLQVDDRPQSSETLSTVINSTICGEPENTAKPMIHSAEMLMKYSDSGRSLAQRSVRTRNSDHAKRNPNFSTAK
jgi:hypothetical protein